MFVINKSIFKGKIILLFRGRHSLDHVFAHYFPLVSYTQIIRIFNSRHSSLAKNSPGYYGHFTIAFQQRKTTP